MYANCLYLLVNEHHDNIFRPVGGVYKFETELNIAEKFEGEYDGIHGVVEDTENDLRLIISTQKLKNFSEWFASRSHRETISNLTREFCEELIETDILDASFFKGKKLTYVYVGSCREESINEQLKIPQVQFYDVVNVAVG